MFPIVLVMLFISDVMGIPIYCLPKTNTIPFRNVPLGKCLLTNERDHCINESVGVYLCCIEIKNVLYYVMSADSKPLVCSKYPPLTLRSELSPELEITTQLESTPTVSSSTSTTTSSTISTSSSTSTISISSTSTSTISTSSTSTISTSSSTSTISTSSSTGYPTSSNTTTATISRPSSDESSESRSTSKSIMIESVSSGVLKKSSESAPATSSSLITATIPNSLSVNSLLNRPMRHHQQPAKDITYVSKPKYCTLQAYSKNWEYLTLADCNAGPETLACIYSECCIQIHGASVPEFVKIVKQWTVCGSNIERKYIAPPPMVAKEKLQSEVEYQLKYSNIEPTMSSLSSVTTPSDTIIRSSTTTNLPYSTISLVTYEMSAPVFNKVEPTVSNAEDLQFISSTTATISEPTVSNAEDLQFITSTTATMLEPTVSNVEDLPFITSTTATMSNCGLHIYVLYLVIAVLVCTTLFSMILLMHTTLCAKY